jgi:hypothetical protein
MYDVKRVLGIGPMCYTWACLIVPQNEHITTREISLSVSGAPNTQKTTTGVTYTTAEANDQIHCPEHFASMENWKPDSDNPSPFQAQQWYPSHDDTIKLNAFELRPASPLHIAAHSGQLTADLITSAAGPAALNLGPAGILCGGEWGGVGAGEWGGEAAIDAPITGDIGPLEGKGNLDGTCNFEEMTTSLPDYRTDDITGTIGHDNLYTAIAPPDGETIAMRARAFDITTTIGRRRTEGMSILPVRPKPICIFTLGLAPNVDTVPTGLATTAGMPGRFTKSHSRDWVVLDQTTCLVPGEVTLTQKGRLHLQRGSVLFLHCQFNGFDDQVTQIAFIASLSIC